MGKMSLRKTADRLDRATLCGLGAVLLWSTTVALARSLAEKLGPLTSAAAVYLTGGAFCLGYLLWSGNPGGQLRRYPRRYLFGCSVLFVLYILSLFLAIGLATDRYQVLEIGMVNYLWPSLTILLSLVLLGQKPRLLLVPATVLALAGIFLVLTQGVAVSWTSFARHLSTNPAAYSLALAAAVSWALYSNLTRLWADPHSGGAVPFFVLAAGVALLLLRLLNPEPGAWNLRAVLEVLFLGLATALAYVFWDIAMRKGDVVLVAACSYFTPLFSTLVSCLYLAVVAGVDLWLGCLFIVAGSLLSRASVAERTPPFSNDKDG